MVEMLGEERSYRYGEKLISNRTSKSGSGLCGYRIELCLEARGRGGRGGRNLIEAEA